MDTIVDNQHGVRAIFNPPFHQFPDLPRQKPFLAQKIVDHIVTHAFQVLGQIRARAVLGRAGQILHILLLGYHRPNMLVFALKRKSCNGNILVATSGSCAAGNCLSIRAKKKEDRIYRQADLSSCTAATVSYNYNNQLEKKDRVDFEVSGDGGSNYDRLRSYTKDNTGSGTENFTLTAAQTAANTRLRFCVNKDNKDKFLFIDNVEIACDSSVSTKDNIPGGTYADLNNGVPPNLVQSTDGFTLAANDILTVTFQVQVDDPLASAVTQISNTASVTTDLITTAINASVTDYIPHLDSYEGDNAGNSTYLTLDELFYRDTSATGNAETALYTGGQGYLPIPPMT